MLPRSSPWRGRIPSTTRVGRRRRPSPPQGGVVVEHRALDDLGVGLVAAALERVAEVVDVVLHEPAEVEGGAAHLLGRLVAEQVAGASSSGTRPAGRARRRCSSPSPLGPGSSKSGTSGSSAGPGDAKGGVRCEDVRCGPVVARGHGQGVGSAHGAALPVRWVGRSAGATPVVGEGRSDQGQDGTCDDQRGSNPNKIRNQRCRNLANHRYGGGPWASCRTPHARRAPLDDVDRAILRILADNARTPNNALAEAVGIAPSTCLARVRALRERGVIRGVPGGDRARGDRAAAAGDDLGPAPGAHP